jgi:precorrin-6x reductase
VYHVKVIPTNSGSFYLGVEVPLLRFCSCEVVILKNSGSLSYLGSEIKLPYVALDRVSIPVLVRGVTSHNAFPYCFSERFSELWDTLSKLEMSGA